MPTPERSPNKVLVVSDDAGTCDVLRDALTHDRLVTAHTGSEALRLIGKHRFAIMVLDLRPPEMGAPEMLQAVKDQGCGPEVVVLTGCGDVEGAVTAMKLGAHDYLQKPVDPTRLRDIIRRAAEAYRLKAERVSPVPRETCVAAPGFLGDDPKILAVRGVITRVAPTTATVLITGETGTGKELVARMIHAASRQAAGPFQVIDCPSVPASLFESEVFGHERGAFTGAVRQRRGRLTEADGGTLFLDEVGELVPEVQAKLLRFLQEHAVTPVGANRPVRVDARVVSATNRDLAAMVTQGMFRADLFYRLNVVQIDLPPLRQRLNDIPLLVAYFVERICRQEGVPSKAVPRSCLDVLVAYHWPGNVRELESVLRQACILAPGRTIGPNSLPPHVRGRIAPTDRGGLWLERSLAWAEREHVLALLRREEWNVCRAARAAGVHRATLYRRLKAWGLRAQALGDIGEGGTDHA